MVVTNGVMVRLVAGEAAGVVAVYARAVAQADRVQALLAAAELDLRAVRVVPSVTGAGEPVVYLTGLTGPARQLLARILRSGAGPPPVNTGQDVPEVPGTTQTTETETGMEGRGS